MEDHPNWTEQATRNRSIGVIFECVEKGVVQRIRIDDVVIQVCEKSQRHNRQHNFL